MATKLPRLNVVLDADSYKAVGRISKKEGLSMSLIARDLLREALVIYEDVFWAKEAEKREKTFMRSKAISHDAVWGRQGCVSFRFKILYHPDVPAKDLPRLSSDIKQRIRIAIEKKLQIAPQEFGSPLRRSLKGYWKLRVGDWRVIYKVGSRNVEILRIGHRREIYDQQKKRDAVLHEGGQGWGGVKLGFALFRQRTDQSRSTAPADAGMTTHKYEIFN